MKICIVAPAKSGSTAVYNSLRNAVSINGYCHGFFEPQKPWPIMKLKNYDFSEDFITKIMVSRLVKEKSDFHIDWFDKRILLVRDIKDILVSELLFRPMMDPLNIDEESLGEFVDLIKQKERNPKEISLVSLHDKANKLGISQLDWNIYKEILDKLCELKHTKEFHIIKYEDYSKGDYSYLSSIINTNIHRSNLEESWVSHIQRKGKSGEWKKWLTAEDLDFIESFFKDYIFTFNYSLADRAEIISEPIDSTFGSTYVYKKFQTRKNHIALLTNNEEDILSAKDYDVLVSRAKDGSLQHIDKLISLRENNNLPHTCISEYEFEKLKLFRKVLS